MRTIRTVVAALALLALVAACCVPIDGGGGGGRSAQPSTWTESISIARRGSGGLSDCTKTVADAPLSEPLPSGVRLHVLEPQRIAPHEVVISDCETLADEFPPLGICILSFDGTPHIADRRIRSVRITHTRYVYNRVAQARLDCDLPIATWLDGVDVGPYGSAIRQRVNELRR